MKLSIKAGSTSESVNIFIADSSSTTGAGLTGLVYNSAGLVAYYSHSGANATATAITLATLAAVNSAYSSGGFKEIDATNMPGWYRFDIPDAVIAASKGRSVAIHLKGATNMAPLPIEIELTGWNNQDSVRGGLTALPNANAAASGGLIINGSNTGTVTLAALTITGTFTISDGIVVTCSTSNRTGILVTGNGTGHGVHFRSGSGATGEGFICQALSTNGHGFAGYASGSFNGIYGYGGGGTGNGIKGQGGDTSGIGIWATAISGSAMSAASASGFGFQIVAGASNNSAVKLTPAGSGYGIEGTLQTAVAVSGAVGSVTGNVGGNVVGSVASVVGNVGGNVVGSVASVSGAVGSVTGNVGGNVSGSVGSVVGAVGSVTGNVGGNVTGSVGSVATGGIAAASFAAGAIDAAAIATGAIDADALATDAVTEIIDAVKAFEVETGVSFLQAMRAISAMLAGTVSGGGTGTETFKSIGGSTTRVTATADSSGNRSAMTLNL